MNVIAYKLYMLYSTYANNSKALGAIGDAIYRRAAKDKLRATREFFEANADRAERVASLLADEKSRGIYRSIIQYRCSRERRYIDPHMQDKKTAYLDRELVTPGEREVFADVGGFQGNTSLFFQDACLSAGRPAPQCVIFEPDPFNFTRLEKNLPRLIKKPVCFQMGLGRERGQLNFNPGKLSMSKIEPSGRGVIEVDTLDSVLESMPGLSPVTYIKIDVEGADLDVLIGARKTIREIRPRIAVSIYHRDEHMLEIPEFMHEICPDYKLYVRHYSCADGETILYCI